MMQTLATISLDLQRPSYETVYAAQEDSVARGVMIALTAGGVPWTPPTGAIAVIEVRKPDGTECVYDTLEDGETPAYSIDGSTITVIWAAQALSVPGDALAAIRFYNADRERLTTFSFRLRVPAGVCPDSGITSSAYYSVLTQQIAALLGATSHPPQIDPDSRNWLLWDEHAGGYTDSGYCSKGDPGPPEIPTTTVHYQAGTSPTTAPTGTWQTAPPAVPAGAYLWTRVRLHYSSGTDATYFSVAYQGQNGAGTQLVTYAGKIVAVADWVDETSGGGTATYADYPLHADIVCIGVTVNDYAHVAFAPTDAASGNYAAVCSTGEGTVRIWAAAIPSAALVIPNIAVFRG